MAFWSNWFARTERKYDSLELFRDIYGGRTTTSGRTVNWATALEVSTVLACCKVIAEGIAQVPWKVFKDTGGEIRNAQAEHPLYRLLYRKPNRWQTSFEFRETIAFHLVLKSNAYVFVGRVGSKREIKELVPLEPQFMSVEKLATGDLRYTYRPVAGQSATFSSKDIWHIRGPSWNTWIGMDAVTLAREAISLAMATETTQGNMHKNGLQSAGSYAVDGNLSPEKYDFLAKWLDKYAFGGERVGKPMILDMGAKWLNQQMTGVDAQHLETRRHQIEEICREFRVMPIMVGFTDKTATYASAEQMFLAHVVHTLSPWYERLEHSADNNLLTEDEINQGFYTKFIPNALMRGAAKDRAEFYKAALGGNGIPGWMLPDEVRALEEMSPTDGGDKLYVPPPPNAQQQGAA
jgi:HK97 family phage portal protein